MSTDDQHVPLPGSERRMPAQARRLGATKPLEPISVSVYLRRRNAAREGFIFVPLELQQVVIGVFGLDGRPQANAHFRLGRKGLHGKGESAAIPAPRSYNPTEVATIYRFPAKRTGAGETIGIIELGGGYKDSDLRT
jgi:hypothetical protein